MDYNNNFNTNENPQGADPNYNQNNSPEQNNQPQYNTQPQYNQPPQYNGQPQYSQPPQYNGQPQYNQPPQYNGQPQYTASQYGQPMYYPQAIPDNSKGLAITSLVLGILSFICCGFPFSIAGFICGLVSRTRKSENNGLALAGIIVSAIGFVVTIITLVVMFTSGDFANLMSDLYY